MTLMTWDVEFTHQFGEWFDTLSGDDQDQVADAVELLEQHGPSLKRPVVGQISGTVKHHNLKELITGSMRVIFAFDPRRTAILLLGGDKAEAGWKLWYRSAVPEAEQLYEEHLAALKGEGLL